MCSHTKAYCKKIDTNGSSSCTMEIYISSNKESLQLCSSLEGGEGGTSQQSTNVRIYAKPPRYELPATISEI